MLYLESTLGNSSTAEVVPLFFEKRHDADRNGIAAAGCSVNDDKGISPKFKKLYSRIPVLFKSQEGRLHLAHAAVTLCLSASPGPSALVLALVPGPSGQAGALTKSRSVSVCAGVSHVCMQRTD